MTMKVKLDSFLTEIIEKTTQNNQYPVLTSSKSGLFLQSDYFNKQVASKDNTGYKVIRRGQFTYRAMSDTGEFFPNILDCADVGIVSPAYPVFEISNTGIIIPEYLKYFFKSNSFQYSINTFAQGSTRTSIKFNKLKTVTIDLPSITRQHIIVSTLDKLQSVIAKRKQQLEKLDQLVKARFVEMFGDSENNNKKWPVYKLCELCDIGSSKRIYQEEQTAEGIPFWRISDLVSMMDTGYADSGLYISQEKYDELTEKKQVPIEGDILVTSRGTLGRCFIISAADRFYFQDGMISWLSKYKKGITPLYIKHLFMTSGLIRQIDGMQAGSTVAYLSIAMLKKLDIMLPDPETQNQFAAFVTQTDKSKFDD